MDVFDVLGYEYYSPLFAEGRRRWRGVTARILKRLSPHFSEVCEIGAGGGVWLAFLEEKLGVTTTGVEINERMVELWEKYKAIKNLRSEMIRGDAREIDCGSAYLILDNTIMYFSRDELRRMLSKADSYLIEFQEFEAISATGIYLFCGRLVEESIVPLNERTILRTFRRGNVEATILQYIYRAEDFEDCEVLRVRDRVYVWRF